ncbi:MAG: hypothetical protein DRI65_04440 [Chloroflexota bacterium]|nr:MAG: hypothetical protein DRI65_04440 [Chloroflexota bacterium]
MRKTEIVCVIDNSGSMGLIKTDAIGGFNQFIEDQRKVEGEAVVSIYLFNQGVTQIADCMDLEDVELLTEDTYTTSGMTAMNDALGKAMDETGNRILKTKADKRPEKVIFCVLTDGEENASTEYTLTHVKDQIRHRRVNFEWEFVFLAANQDALETAKDYAFSPKSSFNFEASAEGVRDAYANMSSYVTTARS